MRKDIKVSKDILKGLQSSTSSGRLDIVTDFYDDSTGLYSEGVWHNCLAGIASLQLRKINNQQKYLDDALQIANSLFKYSWDGTSFRRRVWSGKWDHLRLLEDNNDIEQANYYLESSEHRCIQHSIALSLWSMLAKTESTRISTIHNQQSLILKQFIDQFWNGKRWTTISKSQGSGTTRRPSASSGKKTNTDSSSDDVQYFRAVDQALAVLALLEHIKLLDSREKEATSNSEREHIVHIIQITCMGILNDFGYNDISNARTYLGINRNRNFWHEGWTMLALSCAREYVWPMDTREGHLQLLWNGIEKLYTNFSTSIDEKGDDNVDYTIYHWQISEKDIKSNVRYCGDNTLAYAIRRSMRYETATISDDKDASFLRFIDMLRSNGNKGENNYHHLASVADVYTQVRLHPNTELAALLLWPT